MKESTLDKLLSETPADESEERVTKQKKFSELFSSAFLLYLFSYLKTYNKISAMD